ncbi:MAG TPA: ACT domain-containing protein [Blastocatellia bacterium]|nr:ACT domain-containing protein [Blastocatellia bacterium]
MKLSLSEEVFAICRLAADSPVPGWALAGSLYSITRTADELSVVCPQDQTPEETRADRGWRCMKVHGPLAFSMTGIMASLVVPLADARIGVFVFSTFDTDYLMVKESDLERAIRALIDAGHEVER